MSEDPETRTQTSIGSALGVSQPSVADWVNGKSRPKPKFAAALHNLTRGRVHRDGWLTDQERASADEIKPMRRASSG